MYIFFYLFVSVHRHQPPNPHPLTRFIHILTPGTVLEPLLLPQLPLLLYPQPNRRRISVNMYLPPACGLNISD